VTARSVESVFITASGTGVGKTLVTAALGFQLKQQGRPVTLLKPVLSGYPPPTHELADCDVLLQALGLPLNDNERDAMSPWRFEAPLSPDMAAAKEGRSIEFDNLCEFCQQDGSGTGVRLIEGVGGVMVPLTKRHTVLDWITALGIPSILVVGSYLGTLSHTLTAVNSLQQRNLGLLGIVVSESADSSVAMQDTCATLANFWSGPIVAIPRLTGLQPWRHVPDLTGLLA
jgi:dethiobiotin synthetase